MDNTPSTVRNNKSFQHPWVIAHPVHDFLDLGGLHGWVDLFWEMVVSLFGC